MNMIRVIKTRVKYKMLLSIGTVRKYFFSEFRFSKSRIRYIAICLWQMMQIELKLFMQIFTRLKGEQIIAGMPLRIDYFAYTLIPACQHT